MNPRHRIASEIHLAGSTTPASPTRDTTGPAASPRRARLARWLVPALLALPFAYQPAAAQWGRPPAVAPGAGDSASASADASLRRRDSVTPRRDSQTAHRDTLTARRDSLMQLVLSRIAGREGEPAVEVFRDIRVLTNMRAGQLVRVMNLGFARSLGVSCEHCHVPGEWASNEKSAKGIAREMWNMVGVINRDLLPEIPDLRSDDPAVNCTTCHRGDVKPALNLPPEGSGSRSP